jgi:hypothetical protein
MLTRSLTVAAASFVAAAAQAQISATASFTTQPLGAQFHYSGTLHNTGTTAIATFWFGWIPGYDFLPSGPANIVSPPGWSALPLQEGRGGFSIQWVASSPASAIPAGGSLDGFVFDSPDSPTVLRGPAPVLPFYPVATAYVYIGAPELDPGFSLVAAIGNPCYANCDGSTQPPILNVNDFICFQSRFASGDSYANCDGSTQPPILNVNDFICFQSAFAAGCP